MILGLDHLVILVRDLEAAVAGYRELGFRVTPGGEHADGLTRNALVPFADGTYLELVEFLDPDDPRDNVWGWRAFLTRGGGLIDYCASSDDLAADARRLGEAGLEIYGPDDGGRRLPDGTEIRWKSARIQQEGRALPFLIEDVTPRAIRVPGGQATEHPNGATGISRLLIVVEESVGARQALAALVDGEASGDVVRLGRQEASLETPPEAAMRLDSLGPGPFAAELNAARRGANLDPRLTGGVRIRLRR